MTSENAEIFVEWNIPSSRMDELWSAGWRHFGPFFFRYKTMQHNGLRLHVQPLRLALERFNYSKSHRRILRRNADLTSKWHPTVIDDERRQLFESHKRRFTENIPESLEDFLGWEPSTVPCPNVELSLRDSKGLKAASFLDLGQNSTSSVYAIFAPAEKGRSLGICTMLHEISYAREHGYLYYYPGYTFHEPSCYDYKKRFHGLEWYDWNGKWLPMGETSGGDSQDAAFEGSI